MENYKYSMAEYANSVKYKMRCKPSAGQK